MICWFTAAPGARVPTKGHESDAGWDLYVLTSVVVPPRGFADVPTGIKVELPHGVWLYMCGRSSTIRRRGLLVAPAIIDNGYRGELFFGVQDLTGNGAVIAAGERLAQIIPHQMLDLEWKSAPKLSESERGEHGFGSTGR